MHPLFTPCRIGPVELRNRTIRAAAFEGMCPGNKPSKALFDYHTAVARGGVGMTTVAYAAVCRSGLSFDTQLWMREEIVPELKQLTDSVHAAGAKASIQLGHCGNMSHRRICGCRPVGASSGFNLYSPTFVHGLKREEIHSIAESFGQAVRLAAAAGFDCVEIHAGHGYLISQFLSPYTNHRHDEFGGTLENRMRFMELVMQQVKQAADEHQIGIIVKTNTSDGFGSGLGVEDCIQVARKLEECGAHALVLSGGFVSRAPMYVMRGAMPQRVLYGYMPWKTLWWLKIGVALFGRLMIRNEPFREAFFFDDAVRFRKAVRIPLIFVGGVNSLETIDRVLNAGFEFVAMARPLVHDPAFIDKLRKGEVTRSECSHANYCVARIYNRDMRCHKDCRISGRIQKELDRNARKY